MKKMIAIMGAVAATQLAFAPAAHAIDGTITIDGMVSSQTCTINGNGSGSADFAVTLPSVAAPALTVDGAEAGRTPFTIVVEGCSTKSGTVRTWFEPGANVDPTTKRLKNTAVGGATNVQIGLKNADLSAVVPGTATQDAGIDATSGVASLKYFAQYVATGGAVGAGAVNSSITYLMSYN